MKILIINTLYSPYKIGGAEVSVQMLAEGLVKQGNSVRVICLHEHKEMKQTKHNGVEVVYLPLKNIYWPYDSSLQTKWKRLIWHIIDQYNPWMSHMVLSQLDDFKPDVVHTNNLAGFSVSVWDAVKRRNLRLVHTSRDYYLFHPNCTLFKNGQNMDVQSGSVRFWSWLKKIKSHKIDEFVGISDFIRDLHRNHAMAKRANYHTIYNPVAKLAIEYKREKTDKKTVGFIGRLSTEKGFDTFCEIAEKYKDNSDIQFIAAGRYIDSHDGQYLRRRAKEAKILELGFIPFEQFITQVDAVLLPAKWNEPFGRVAVECAQFVPVFVSSNGGLLELRDKVDQIFNLSNFDKFINDKIIKFDLKEFYGFDTHHISELYRELYFE